MVKLKSFARLQMKQLSLPECYFSRYYEDSKKMSDETLLNIMKANMSYHFSKVESGEIPILLLVGENEKKIMLTSAKDISQKVKGNDHYEGYIIKNAAHGIPYEQPEILNEMIDKFFTGESFDPDFHKVEAL